MAFSGDGRKSGGTRKPHAYILYHYFHPDDVVSARHFDGLARGLRDRGWRVTAMPCNRGCRDESRRYSLSEDWDGIEIRRVWRPGVRQASNLGRLFNAAWMIAAWGLRSLDRTKPDVVIVGTDPVLSVLVTLFWRGFRPSVRLAHWCFDLYPEAAVADEMLRPRSWAVRVMKSLLRAAYRRCDLIADLGSCMKERLATYRSRAKSVTLVPWALSEPARPVAADPEVRQELFGDARLGLLYSGNFGRAHGYAEFLELARRLRDASVCFCFVVRGNRVEELQKAVTPEDTNVRFAGFAPESALEARLAAADIHLTSLRPEWTGVVVPSKFFGSMAAGRPVLFAGGQDAAPAVWIREFGVGWIVDSGNLDDLATVLRHLAESPDRLREVQTRCHAVYQGHFSWRKVLDEWDRELRSVLRITSEPGKGESKNI